MRPIFKLAFFGLILGLVLLLPWVVPASQVSLLTAIFIWGLYALSFDLLFGYTGMLSLGHSVYFGLGAYGAALSVKYLYLSWWAGLGIGFLLALLGALLIGFFAARVKSHGFIIVTAVTALIAFLLAQRWNDLTGGDDGLSFSVAPIAIGSLEWAFSDQKVRYYFALSLLLVSLVFLWWLVRTPLGYAWKLIRENENRAEMMGYPVTQLKFVVFVIAGAFAGLAGATYALTNRFVWAGLFHWIISADGIIWTLFGGAGTLVGALLGTGALFGLKEWLSELWKSGYPLLVGLALLIVIRFAPGGLLGLARALWERRSLNDALRDQKSH
jgi:branched-chain amino acid transport system permease protein